MNCRVIMIHPIWTIILGTVLIASGGLLATCGWNAYSGYEQRRSIISTVASELYVNLAISNDKTFDLTDEAQSVRVDIFLQFRTIALERALTSGLLLNKNDKLLFRLLTELHLHLEDTNHQLIFLENRLVENAGSTSSPKLIEARNNVMDKRIKDLTISKLREVEKLLLSDYDIKESGVHHETLEEDTASNN